MSGGDTSTPDGSASGLAAADDVGPAGSSYGLQVPAVDQAMRLLFYLARDSRREASLSDICRAVGIHKSKGHALLNTLRAAGMVTRRESTRTYALGPAVLALSRAVLDRTELAGAAEPHLAALAEATGTTALLGVVTAGQVFVVARREAPSGIAVTIRVGHRYPLTWGAHGKAITAFLPDEEREELLAGDDLCFNGRPGPVGGSPEALRAELEECRFRGYALDLGGMQTGVSAVSAPLLDSGGRPRAAVILVGTFPVEEADPLGRRAAVGAREMTATLWPFIEGLS